MTARDELFDQQIHDAYERVELGEEAQARMLGALLAAQAQAQTAEEEEVQPVKEAKVYGFPRRHLDRRLWVGVAAALIASLIVVRLGLFGSSSSKSEANKTEEASSTYDAIEQGAQEDAQAYEAAPMDYEESDVAYEMAAPGNPSYDNKSERLVEVFPSLTLPDGTMMTPVFEGGVAVELESSQVGDLIGRATATVASGDAAVDCEIFSVTDGSGSYAVRYEGEQTFWLCEVLS